VQLAAPKLFLKKRNEFVVLHKSDLLLSLQNQNEKSVHELINSCPSGRSGDQDAATCWR
jgi:hypothetical protein